MLRSASYAELNCDGVAQPLYTGTNVGFSSLCVDKEITYTFLDDVLRELAELTAGPYIHIGGDEAMSTPPDAYLRFMQRVQPLVQKYGKKVVGWEELGQAPLLPGTLVQQWNTEPARVVHTLQAVEQGAKVIVSPASRTYLDMKYDADTPLGLQWAGLVPVRDAYDWEPTSYLAGVGEAQVIGVEAPLWAETLRTLKEIEYMVLPRLPGIAEIGWSPRQRAELGRVPHPPGGPGPALGCHGSDLLSLATGELAMMILIAGPYRSGTNDDPKLIAANVHAMTEMALRVFRAGHLPVMGEWYALPLIELAGSERIGDEVFNEIFHPISRQLVARCDAVLRIGGPSSGADEMVSLGQQNGKAVYYRFEDLPAA